MDTVGLLAAELWFTILVGNGLDWFTPENEYAPTTADVEPDIVTTIAPVPVGFFRYQNSASLLEKVDTFFVNGTPPNVTEAASLLSALTPTTSSLLFPVPTLKSASIIGFEGDVELDVDWTLTSVMPPLVVAALVVAEETFDGEPVPTEFIADTRYA
jgi:hypothetical protein